ncbi:hypothetical protein C8F04DRAFT_1260498 [Mycena alexandri]|uniref:Uncharacterized protein n=1 Tax=Mycena alexandri TaxID=1745969 RepID=A0AAD6X2A2_9AGAR|nr:hypothetical protein C8F04DRAFT_1260498 [Mycena alexandri]
MQRTPCAACTSCAPLCAGLSAAVGPAILHARRLDSSWAVAAPVFSSLVSTLLTSPLVCALFAASSVLRSPVAEGLATPPHLGSASASASASALPPAIVWPTAAKALEYTAASVEIGNYIWGAAWQFLAADSKRVEISRGAQLPNRHRGPCVGALWISTLKLLFPAVSYNSQRHARVTPRALSSPHPSSASSGIELDELGSSLRHVPASAPSVNRVDISVRAKPRSVRPPHTLLLVAAESSFSRACLRSPSFYLGFVPRPSPDVELAVRSSSSVGPWSRTGPSNRYSRLLTPSLAASGPVVMCLSSCSGVRRPLGRSTCTCIHSRLRLLALVLARTRQSAPTDWNILPECAPARVRSSSSSPPVHVPAPVLAAKLELYTPPASRPTFASLARRDPASALGSPLSSSNCIMCAWMPAKTFRRRDLPLRSPFEGYSPSEPRVRCSRSISRNELAPHASRLIANIGSSSVSMNGGLICLVGHGIPSLGSHSSVRPRTLSCQSELGALMHASATALRLYEADSPLSHFPSVSFLGLCSLLARPLHVDVEFLCRNLRPLSLQHCRGTLATPSAFQNFAPAPHAALTPCSWLPALLRPCPAPESHVLNFPTSSRAATPSLGQSVLALSILRSPPEDELARGGSWHHAGLSRRNLRDPCLGSPLIL